MPRRHHRKFPEWERCHERCCEAHGTRWATAAEEVEDPSYSPPPGTIRQRKPSARLSDIRKRAQSTLYSTGAGASKGKGKQIPMCGPRPTKRARKNIIANRTGLLIEFLMSKHKMKKSVKKADMLKVVNIKYKKYFPEILQRATSSIEVVFGVDVQEVDTTTHTYVLVSKMNLPNNGRVSPGQGFPKTGLLMSLLGVILMKGNIAYEEEVWEFLNKMNIYAGQKHFIYGEPRKLITQDLVKLQYLSYRQFPQSNPARYVFLWGPRAHQEISETQVLEFLASVNNTEPSVLKQCYAEALGEEEFRAQADDIEATPMIDQEPSPASPPSPVEIEIELPEDFD